MSEGQQVGSPLEVAQHAIQQASMERTRLLALLCVLIQKQENEVVITMAELHEMDQNTELVQSPPTDLGFKLTTRVRQPR